MSLRVGHFVKIHSLSLALKLIVVAKKKSLGSCSDWLQAFAFPEKKLFEPPSEPDAREACRRLAYDLARCLAGKKIARSHEERHDIDAKMMI